MNLLDCVINSVLWVLQKVLTLCITNTQLARFAHRVYLAATKLPLLSLLFFAKEWGPDIKQLYNVFAREEYWGGCTSSLTSLHTIE